MKTLLLLFISISTSVVVHAQQSPQLPSPNASPVPQQLRILPQPEAPARVVEAKVTWALPEDRRGVQIYIVVENVSQKSIRTYTTIRGIESSSEPKACLGPPRLPPKGLISGVKAGTSTWQGVFNSDPPPAVWVDFVEFSDYSRWGADECQTGEFLDGRLAGARAQRDQLLLIFRERGAEGLLVFIRDNFRQAKGQDERPLLPIAPREGHSRRWQEGFTRGAEGMIERVLTAEREWGLDEIERELSRPLDAPEKRP